jgi:hypothetical protein
MNSDGSWKPNHEEFRAVRRSGCNAINFLGKLCRWLHPRAPAAAGVSPLRLYVEDAPIKD